MNSTIKPKPCKICSSPWHTPMFHKERKPLPRPMAPIKRDKRPKQRGKRSYELSDWVSGVARPYLIENYGEVCNVLGCYQANALDVDHVVNKGSHPELRMFLGNVQFLCRPHHREKTDGKVLQYKHDRAYPLRP